MLRRFFMLTALGLVFAACSTRSSLGSGDNNLGKDAGTTSACSGKSCGASCDVGSGYEGYCSKDGTCGLNYPVCEAPSACTADSECVAPAGPCEVCSDGSFACPYAKCESGQCAVGFDSCQGQQCDANNECPQIGAPCQKCPDGTVACPFSECQNGVCVGGFPGCGGEDPCADKNCGEPCAQCPPDDPSCTETAVLKFCDSAGQCGAAYPVCGNQCSTPAECPAIEICKPCPSGDCAVMGCANGMCEWECPPPVNPQCSTPADCQEMPAICKICSDGSCAGVGCVNGTCDFVCQ